MKVKKKSLIKLTPEEIEEIIIKHLKDNNIIQDKDKYDIDFDMVAKKELEYCVAEFNGCTIITYKQ